MFCGFNMDAREINWGKILPPNWNNYEVGKRWGR